MQHQSRDASQRSSMLDFIRLIYRRRFKAHKRELCNSNTDSRASREERRGRVLSNQTRANIARVYFGDRSREHLLLVSSASLRRYAADTYKCSANFSLTFEHTRKYDRRNVTATPGRFNSTATGLRAVVPPMPFDSAK